VKPAEIRALSVEELSEELEGLRKEMFNLRLQQASGQLENAARVRVARREIARLLTVQHERELWAEYEARSAAQGEG
jgi:large subunit ribosomal protein L29